MLKVLLPRTATTTTKITRDISITETGKLFISTKRQQQQKRKYTKMQNPLDVPIYTVGSEHYRRNCPLEMSNTTSLELEMGMELAEDEDRQSYSSSGTPPPPTTSNNPAECEEEENRIEKVEEAAVQKEKVVQVSKSSVSVTATKKLDSSSTSTTSTTIPSKIAPKPKPIAVVKVEKEEKVQLVGTVKFDRKQAIYYDSLKLPSSLVGMVRGREGHKQKKLEGKFACKINIPKKRGAGKETEIKISSTQSAQNVLDCREELEKAIVVARKQAMPTHFISVPIFDLKLREQYSQLVKTICEDEELTAECKRPELFLAPAKLHLTVSVLRLFNEAEVETVRKFLDQLFQSKPIRQILADQKELADGDKNINGIRVQFRTMEHFSDRSAEKVAVLFAKANSQVMQKLANSVDDALAEAGLAEKRKTADVVLHMTLMNTKYLWQKRQTFLNAKPLLEKFGQLNFDPVEVDELHLCEMRGSGDEEDLNGYKSVHSIQFSTI